MEILITLSAKWSHIMNGDTYILPCVVCFCHYETNLNRAFVYVMTAFRRECVGVIWLVRYDIWDCSIRSWFRSRMVVLIWFVFTSISLPRLTRYRVIFGCPQTKSSLFQTSCEKICVIMDFSIRNGWRRWFHRVMRGGKWVNVAVFGSLVNGVPLCD